VKGVHHQPPTPSYPLELDPGLAFVEFVLKGHNGPGQGFLGTQRAQVAQRQRPARCKQDGQNLGFEGLGIHKA